MSLKITREIAPDVSAYSNSSDLLGVPVTTKHQRAAPFLRRERENILFHKHPFLILNQFKPSVKSFCSTDFIAVMVQ